MTITDTRSVAVRPAAPPQARAALDTPVAAPKHDHPLVRSALPCDADALRAMHDRCSLDTRIARWHAPIRVIPASYLAEVSGNVSHHAAVVATQPTAPYEVIGLASACLVAPGAWELGMLVEDAHQRQGVGRAMLRALVDEVVRRGGRELVAISLDERRSVLHSLDAVGPVSLSSRSTTVTARVRLPR